MEVSKARMAISATALLNWGQFTHLWNDAIEADKGTLHMLETAFPVRYTPCTCSKSPSRCDAPPAPGSATAARLFLAHALASLGRVRCCSLLVR